MGFNVPNIQNIIFIIVIIVIAIFGLLIYSKKRKREKYLYIDLSKFEMLV